MKGNDTISTDAIAILNANGTPVATYRQVNNKAMSERKVWTFAREASCLDAWFDIQNSARGIHLDVASHTITHIREISMSYYYNEIVLRCKNLGGEEE